MSFITLVLRGGIEYADVELGDQNLSGPALLHGA